MPIDEYPLDSFSIFPHHRAKASNVRCNWTQYIQRPTKAEWKLCANARSPAPVKWTSTLSGFAVLMEFGGSMVEAVFLLLFLAGHFRSVSTIMIHHTRTTNDTNDTNDHDNR